MFTGTFLINNENKIWKHYHSDQLLENIAADHFQKYYDNLEPSVKTPPWEDLHTKYLSRLNKKEQIVAELYYRKKMRQKDIAKVVNRTQGCVSNILITISQKFQYFVMLDELEEKGEDFDKPYIKDKEFIVLKIFLKYTNQNYVAKMLGISQGGVCHYLRNIRQRALLNGDQFLVDLLDLAGKVYLMYDSTWPSDKSIRPGLKRKGL